MGSVLPFMDGVFVVCVPASLCLFMEEGVREEKDSEGRWSETGKAGRGEGCKGREESLSGRKEGFGALLIFYTKCLESLKHSRFP